MTTTTITREQLLSKAKTEFKWVDVEGFGRIGVRSCPELQRSRRIASLFDSNGNLLDNHRHLQRIYKIIDQVMLDEGEPMFSEKDIKELGELDAAKLDPVIFAINSFNEGSEKNELAGSSDSK